MSDEKQPGDFEYEITQSGDLIVDGAVVDRDPARAESAADSLPVVLPPPTHVTLDGEDVPLDEIRRLRKRYPELESTVREIEPFREVLQSRPFQEWLETAVQNEMFTPNVLETPEPQDIVGYRKRAQDPEYHAILEEMNDWAKKLPAADRHLIDNSYRKFNEVFDSFKALHGGAQVGREIVERELRKRERSFDQSISVRSGVSRGGSETYGPGNIPTNADQRIETLKTRARRGSRDAEVLLAKALLDGDCQ